MKPGHLTGWIEPGIPYADLVSVSGTPDGTRGFWPQWAHIPTQTMSLDRASDFPAYRDSIRAIEHEDGLFTVNG